MGSGAVSSRKANRRAFIAVLLLAVFALLALTIFLLFYVQPEPFDGRAQQTARQLYVTNTAIQKALSETETARFATVTPR